MTKTAFSWVVALAALAFGGTAKADVYISDTLKGIVTSGVDTVGFFGAPNTDLMGSAVGITFSYDYTSLVAAGIFSSDGFSTTLSDFSGDAAVTQSVTINNRTFSLTNGVPSLSLGSVEAFDGPPGIPGPLLGLLDLNTNTGSVFLTSFYGANNFPLGSLGDQAAVSSFLAAPLSGFGPDLVGFGTAGGNSLDALTVDATLASAPEPSLRFSLAMLLGAMLLVKLRRHANRS